MEEVQTEKLILDIFTQQVADFLAKIPHDWEDLQHERAVEFEKEVSMSLLDILLESEELDSEAIAYGNETSVRGGIFNANLDSLNEIVRRLDKITETKSYYGSFEEEVNVQLIVKICAFISARAVSLMFGKSYDDDENQQHADEDSEEIDLYTRDSSGPQLSEPKCIEKVLKWFRRIGREDTDRAEELCGYVQLFVSPNVEEDFITFKDKFLMSLFGVDLFDIEKDREEDEEDYDDEEDSE